MSKTKTSRPKAERKVIVAGKAKENQRKSEGRGKKGLAKLPDLIDTRKELAKAAPAATAQPEGGQNTPPAKPDNTVTNRPLLKHIDPDDSNPGIKQVYVVHFWDTDPEYNGITCGDNAKMRYSLCLSPREAVAVMTKIRAMIHRDYPQSIMEECFGRVV